jgi:hypothetical protein
LKKVTLIVLVALAVFTLSGCAKTNPDEIKVTQNTSFRLPVGKTAVLKGENISIKFDSVSADSRCPSGVTCIWAGEAKCKLLVSENKQTKELVLTQSGSAENPLSDLAGGYKLSFQLSPYPKSGSQINPQDYILDMKIYK